MDGQFQFLEAFTVISKHFNTTLNPLFLFHDTNEHQTHF